MLQKHRLPLTTSLLALMTWCYLISSLTAQTTVSGSLQQGSVTPQDSSPTGAPVTVTLADAITRARLLDVQYRAALLEAGLAHEDRIQARSALLPTLTYDNQFLYTEGDGSAAPRFIANNGIHEYVSQANAHQLLSGAQFADYGRTRALETAARARAELAGRGLVAAVVKTYYTEIISRRKYSSAQLGADEATRFYETAVKLERGGEVAHADVIKAQLQAADTQRALSEARLQMEQAHVELTVLLFATFNQNFSTVDDLGTIPSLPSMQDIESQAKSNNPVLYAALQAYKATIYEVRAARAAYLPTLALDYFYGIDASHFSANSPGPDGNIRNLGYSASATLSIPIWNWGATHSKVKQAELRKQQANTELSAANRHLLADLRTLYSEAMTARAELDSLRQSVELASDQVRLTNLRYRAGEATALEVVEAQNSLIIARNNFDDGQVRYRVAISNLQTVTGAF